MRADGRCSTETGYAAAKLAALKVRAQLDRAVGCSRLVGLGRYEAYVQATDGWNAYSRVLDGASEVCLAAWGPEIGVHSRMPLGVAHVPGNAPVALAVTAVLREDVAVEGIPPASVASEGLPDLPRMLAPVEIANPRPTWSRVRHRAAPADTRRCTQIGRPHANRPRAQLQSRR